VQSRVRDLGIERILGITLLLANRFLHAAIPEALKNLLMVDEPARRLADEIALSVVAGKTYHEEQLSYFHLMMRLRERPSDRLRFLARLALTPGPGEWEAVRLPRALFPLYRIVRMARLAARFARG